MSTNVPGMDAETREALREAESALAIAGSYRAPDQARITDALNRVRNVIAKGARAGEPKCLNCGHAMSAHIMEYHPTERPVCREGGIIEPDDVGYQCGCDDPRAEPTP